MASDQDLQFFIKKGNLCEKIIKNETNQTSLLIGKGCTQNSYVEESTRHKWIIGNLKICAIKYQQTYPKLYNCLQIYIQLQYMHHFIYCKLKLGLFVGYSTSVWFCLWEWCQVLKNIIGHLHWPVTYYLTTCD